MTGYLMTEGNRVVSLQDHPDRTVGMGNANSPTGDPQLLLLNKEDLRRVILQATRPDNVTRRKG